jgi:hypothetical protein
MDVFCRDDDLAWLPFGGRIRLERLWEDRVMSDRGDGEGTVLVQAGKGAALSALSFSRRSAKRRMAMPIVMHAAGLTFGRR